MGVHRFAVATALATFALLIAGGLVSTTESGLACPDWPLCEGQLIPKMVDGKEYEHTHRLVASFVGAMTFGLCALLFKHRRRDRLLTRLGVAAGVLVVAQALLGALTVLMKLPWWVSTAHLATAMGFFALSVTLALLTRQRLLPRASPAIRAEQARLGWAILPVLGLTYLQVVAGGLMRHLRGGLACGFDFPLCLGELWPLDGHVGVQVHMIHRVLGYLVGVAVVSLAVWLWRQPSASRAVRLAAVGAAVAVALQVGLGILTLLWTRELVTMTLHSSVGAGLLAAMTALYWLARPEGAAESARADAPVARAGGVLGRHSEPMEAA